ncbi:uncharacterized protein ARB_04741 [Trichophyton benhamiae CBS 112371]|uniref:Uncharacterized protein n=1 Tax=Arthroderma benhamiae (strain ATCC MYA-4681 / CBS 112371) TaxID=663331 RepID=D4AM51_ARTBC|nr:uncharacterized protein ARB_04741 [Trichophyton benhamiae CBS 112371]EFE35807.1 hypothetical protein ARB_04741 [Trichophyton benhamiae CBS 112371]
MTQSERESRDFIAQCRKAAKEFNACRIAEGKELHSAAVGAADSLPPPASSKREAQDEHVDSARPPKRVIFCDALDISDGAANAIPERTSTFGFVSVLTSVTAHPCSLKWKNVNVAPAEPEAGERNSTPQPAAISSPASSPGSTTSSSSTDTSDSNSFVAVPEPFQSHVTPPAAPEHDVASASKGSPVPKNINNNMEMLISHADAMNRCMSQTYFKLSEFQTWSMENTTALETRLTNLENKLVDQDAAFQRSMASLETQLATVCNLEDLLFNSNGKMAKSMKQLADLNVKLDGVDDDLEREHKKSQTILVDISTKIDSIIRDISNLHSLAHRQGPALSRVEACSNRVEACSNRVEALEEEILARLGDGLHGHPSLDFENTTAINIPKKTATSETIEPPVAPE